MNLTDVLAERIKAAREAVPMTQKELSNTLGIRQQTLSGYETGRMRPTIDALVAIAEKCNVSMDWLCGLSENRQNYKELKTGADVIDNLLALSNAVHISVEQYYIDDEYYETLAIHDTAFQFFISDWKRMLELYRDSVIEKSLYDLWIKEQKNIFGRYELGNKTSFDEIMDYIGFIEDSRASEK